MIDVLRETDLGPDQREMIETVRESAFSLLRIIDDILDFSKIEAGKLDLEEVPVSIAKVVEGVSDTLVPMAYKKQVELVIFSDPRIPEWVSTDPIRLRQILFNLAGNAVKFTGNEPEKPGRVVIRADLREADEASARVRFRISDNGIGMRAETVAKLFQPFTQAESSTTRRFGGTGLGLSISMRLIQLMDGRIQVESEPGVGSSFSVELGFQRAPSPPSEERRFDLSNLSVVVVSATGDVEEILSRYLTHGGAQVLQADRVEDALRHASAAKGAGRPFVIVVVDAENDKSRAESLRSRFAAIPELTGTRFVIIQRGRRRIPRLAGPDSVALDANAMRRSALLRAVAVAAGRASPEQEVEEREPLPNRGHVPGIEEAESAGRLILVAEDNKTNQKVIMRQLNLLGCAAEVADNGREALHMWLSRRYGLVLTDCHMPEMDGFELTAALRQAESRNGRHTPIVAITANALKGEAERCHAAGMDDYLAKPIQLVLLRDMLAKWLPPSAGAADAERQAVEPRSATADQDRPGSTAPVNTGVLKEIIGDDPALVAEFLRDFLTTAREAMAEIRIAYDKRSERDVGAIAHKLKSSARTVGAGELADLCQELERAGNGADWAVLDVSMTRLEPCFLAVEGFILVYSAHKP